jgi:hypothetical protein
MSPRMLAAAAPQLRFRPGVTVTNCSASSRAPFVTKVDVKSGRVRVLKKWTWA